MATLRHKHKVWPWVTTWTGQPGHCIWTRLCSLPCWGRNCTSGHVCSFRCVLFHVIFVFYMLLAFWEQTVLSLYLRRCWMEN